MSIKEQKEDRQVEALKEYGIKEENIFVDKISGKDFNRPEYQFIKELMKRTSNNILIIFIPTTNIKFSYIEVLKSNELKVLQRENTYF